MGSAAITVYREQVQSDDFVFLALFARMDTVAMTVAICLFFALGLASATAVLLLQGAGPRRSQLVGGGQHPSRL